MGGESLQPCEEARSVVVYVATRKISTGMMGNEYNY